MSRFARPLDIVSPRTLHHGSKTPSGSITARSGSSLSSRPGTASRTRGSSGSNNSMSMSTLPRPVFSSATTAAPQSPAVRVPPMSSPLPRIATLTSSRYHREREVTPPAVKAFPPGCLERCGETGSIYYTDADGRVCVDKLIASLEEVTAVIAERREAESEELRARAHAAAADAARAAGLPEDAVAAAVAAADDHFTAALSAATASAGAALSGGSDSDVSCGDPLSAASLALGAATTAPPQLVLLVLTGAFAPVHRAHTALLDTAQAAIEADGDKVVIARFLNVASDAYMKTKVPNSLQHMELDKRAEMCELAVRACPLTAVCPYGWVSSERAADKLRHIALRIVTETPSFAAALAPRPDVAVVQVCGANTALRQRLYARGSFLAVARPGCSVARLIDDVRQARARQDALGPAHRFRLVDPAQAHSPYPPVPPCSATRLRDLVCREGGPREEELRKLDWLEPEVLEYLLRATQRFQWLCRY